MSKQQDNFFDSKTIIAILLVGGSWMGWQWYLQKKYPDAYKTKTAAEQSNTQNPQATQQSPADVPTPNVEVPEEKKAEALENVQKPESSVDFEDENLAFQISSKGMGLQNIRLKKYTDRKGELVRVGHSKGFLPLETNLIGKRTPLHFNVEKAGDSVYIGHANVNGLLVTKKITIQSARYTVDSEVEVAGSQDGFQGLTTYLADEIKEQHKSSFMLPQLDHQEFFASASSSHERWPIHPDEDMTQSLQKANVVSLGSQYFAQALVDRSTVQPELKVIVDKSTNSALAVFSYGVLNRSESFKIQYTSFVGPKSYSLLSSIDEELGGVVNYGMFSFIAHYILALLKWFYLMVGNWGVAIILLTILVRLLVLPFAIMSYRSMKAMQQIQPQIKALREKYKNDQQKLNLEMMGLLKTHKVNPLGGCLPLFLQFPIFLALYQVLGQGIELYQAPFMFWIHDLSLKDPFYVLPVLMGLTLFIQQKITPSTLDPMQAKVLMFMPLLFTFFMVSLPSGLTLYIFVSGVFGILQQLYFTRDKAGKVPALIKTGVKQ